MIQSFSEFVNALDDIRSKHPDLTLVYRGQTRDRPFLPSIKRPAQDENYAKALPYISAVWDKVISEMLTKAGLSRFASRQDYVSAGMAMLQHYGFRTWFIDVSLDPLVSLWFAVNRYFEESVILQATSCYLPDGTISPYAIDHCFGVVKQAHYEKLTSGVGYFYVLGIPPGDRALLLHLLLSVPADALRVHRQSGAGMLEPLDGRSLDAFTIAKFEIATSVELPDFTENGSGLNQESLFPPPNEDKVYKGILSAPFYTQEHNSATDHLRLAYQFIQVPVYASPEVMFAQIMPLIKVYVGDEAFRLVPATLPDSQATKTIFRGETKTFQEATVIQLPILHDAQSDFQPQHLNVVVEKMDGKKEETVTKRYEDWIQELFSGPLPSDLWPSSNLYFEYATATITAPRVTRGITNIIRGIWVIWHPEEVYIAQFVDEGRDFSLEYGSHFRLIDNKFVLYREQEDCQEDDDDAHLAQLAIFLMYSRRARSGESELYKVSETNFHLYWRTRLEIAES